MGQMLMRRRRFLLGTSVSVLALPGCGDFGASTSATASPARPRGVSKIVTAQPRTDGAGVKLGKSLGSNELPQLDPFLMLDEIRSHDAADYEKGFPRHPHRGFETVTYMLSGALEHRDSVGNRGLLVGGSAQWMTAGSGIIHSEMPQQTEGLLWGLQLWVNLPRALKMTAPRYQDVAKARIPELQVSGAGVRLVAGSLNGERGPVDGISVDPTMLEITLPKAVELFQPLVPSHNAFIYVLEGGVLVGPERAFVQARQLAVLSAGEGALLRSEGGARLLLLAGEPIGEPVARRGPFVMNTEAELDQAVSDYQNGRLVRDS